MGGLLIANHLDQSLWWKPIRNTEQQSDHTYYTLFSAGAHRRCCALKQPPQTVHAVMLSQNPFSLSQAGMFWLFFIQLYCGGLHTEHRWRCSKANSMVCLGLSLKLMFHSFLFGLPSCVQPTLSLTFFLVYPFIWWWKRSSDHFVVILLPLLFVHYWWPKGQDAVGYFFEGG